MSTDEYVPSEDEVRGRYCDGTYMQTGHTSEGDDFDAWLAGVRRDAAREAAQMIRDACDRWEVDGDDERLVNEVLDPWTTRILTTEETP